MGFDFADCARQLAVRACRKIMKKALKIYRADPTPENRDGYVRALRTFIALVLSGSHYATERSSEGFLLLHFAGTRVILATAKIDVLQIACNRQTPPQFMQSTDCIYSHRLGKSPFALAGFSIQCHSSLCRECSVTDAPHFELIDGEMI